MDEIITEERRERLKKQFTEVADRDLLTNGDALMIIEILHQACARKKADITEKYLADSFCEEGDTE